MQGLIEIMVLPLLGAATITAFKGLMPKRLAGIWATILVAASFALSVAADVRLSHLSAGHRVITGTVWNWVTGFGPAIHFQLYLDPLAGIWILIITGVGALIHLYSIGYMHDDKGEPRYFTYLNFFIFSMLLLVLAGNLAVLLIGYHAPRPHHAHVDVVGSPTTVRALVQDVSQSEPGALNLVRVRSAETGLEALREGRLFGVLTLVSSPTLYVAGANGPAVTSALDAIFSHAIISPSTSLHTVDKLPLLPNDTSGLPLFYLVFGIVIASYLFALSSVSVGRSLSPVGHWASAALLALLLAGSSSAIARFGTQTIVAHATIVFVILFLLSLAVGAGTAMFLGTFRTFGATMATVVLVTLSSASGDCFGCAASQLARSNARLLAHGGGSYRHS